MATRILYPRRGPPNLFGSGIDSCMRALGEGGLGLLSGLGRRREIDPLVEHDDEGKLRIGDEEAPGPVDGDVDRVSELDPAAQIVAYGVTDSIRKADPEAASFWRA